MNFKTLTILITIAFFIGIGIILGERGITTSPKNPYSNSQATNSTPTTSTNDVSELTPLSISEPPSIIINVNGDLKVETEKLIPEDFSEDFKSLKSEVAN